METTHRLLQGDARDLSALGDASVDLVVTSPPYPMIEMWDAAFRAMSPEAGRHLDGGDGVAAFEAMHRELDRAWAACHRVLRPGGFACVNIGDATRTVAGHFRLYPNHARILSAMVDLGFTVLPDVLWRKPTNGPTRFMGSGMLPAGAYVTYEHEYVLVLRKGDRRRFRGADRERRARSAFFWEERNAWFSDLWADLKGARQRLDRGDTRARSAAFPLELPWRLVHMYALQEDVVLDPFAGTGTTLCAALAAGRSSVGVEREAPLLEVAREALPGAVAVGARLGRERLRAHEAFVAERAAMGKPPKHRSEPYGFPVVTRQEARLRLPRPVAVEAEAPGLLRARYGWCELDAAAEAAPADAPTPG